MENREVKGKKNRMLFLADSSRVVEDDAGELFLPGEFSNGMLERYMRLCDEFVIVCRKDNRIFSNEEAKNSYNMQSSNKIEVVCIKDRFASIKNYFSLSEKKFNDKIIENEIKKADFIVVRAFSSMSTGRFYELLHKYHKKVLVESIGCSWAAMWNHGIRGKILASSSFFSTRKRIKNADYVCYVTKKFLQKRYPTKGKQISISDVDIPDLDIAILERRKEKIQNHVGVYRIGTVAAVNVDYKGQKYVIKALAWLRRRGNQEFEYHCVGGGSNEKLKRLSERLGVSDSVFFVGSLPHDKVIRFLDSIDLYIQPSLLEGLPRALVEAMSRGIPGFGSNVGGLPELLEKKCLFKKKSVKQIIKFLEMVNQEFLLEQAERNFEVAKKYEPKKNDKKRLEFYSRYVSECEKR